MPAHPIRPGNDQLRQARRAMGLTQTRLARKLGVPQSTVARLELAQHEPTLRHALAICRELGSTVEALFGQVVTPEKARARTDEFADYPELADWFAQGAVNEEEARALLPFHKRQRWRREHPEADPKDAWVEADEQRSPDAKHEEQ
jgi:putative transcriptional regulator